MGPVYQTVVVMTADGVAQPLQTPPAWQHRTPEVDVVMQFTVQSTDANVEYEVVSGSEAIVQRSTCPGGGTAATFIAFQENMKSVVCMGGREIYLTLFETASGTPSVNVEVHLTPI